MRRPCDAVYNVFSAALRGLGDSRTPFIAVLISSLVNIALDVVLVACLHWGVGGAALATVLSQAAMTLFLVIYSRRKHPLLRFHPGLRMLNRRALNVSGRKNTVCKSLAYGRCSPDE